MNRYIKKITTLVLSLVMVFTFCVYDTDFVYASDTKTGIVNSPTGLNIRSSMSTDSSDNIVIAVNYDTRVTITGESTDSKGGGWYSVNVTFGGKEYTGYCSKEYISVIDTPVSITPVSTETNTTYAEVLMYVGEASGVNPYVLASMILVEQGTQGTGKCIAGDVSGYEGYYNYFNISAVSYSGYTAVQNGLIYAMGNTTYERPWNSRFSSILGGAEFYYSNYVQANQNTLYLKKWNVMNGSTYLATHQYMTNIMGASSESVRLAKGYANNLDEALVFSIPVYENMPVDACPYPTADTYKNQDEITKGSTATDLTQYASMTDYEKSLYDAGFPASYIPYLSSLHDAYPNWIFNAAKTGLDWDTVVAKETVAGRSLVSSSYSSFWKLQKSPAYDEATGTYKSYDSGGWNAASKIAVCYYLDPRNFITQKGIFQFLDHNFNGDSQTVEGITKLLSGTFMEGDFPEYVALLEKKNDAAEEVEEEKQEIDNYNFNLEQGVENTSISLKSSFAKLKSGKNGIKLTWTKSQGYKVDYYEVYKSAKRFSGYGTKPYFTTLSGDVLTYTNTKDLKKGNTYYFKVRGVRILTDSDGQTYKVYTEWSNKSWRTIS